MDILKTSFFIQEWGKEGKLFQKELRDGSIFMSISSNEEFIADLPTLISSVGSGDAVVFADIIRYISKNIQDKFGDFSVAFAQVYEKEERIECICKGMPPILYKTKRSEIKLLDYRVDTLYADGVTNHIKTLSLKDNSTFLICNSHILKNRIESGLGAVFSKCEIIDNFINKKNKIERDIAFVFINNSINDKVEYSHHEILPAKIDAIAEFEEELESILNEAYPNEDIMNVNASMTFNEMILNAYEHGSLLVDSQKKQELMLTGEYDEYMLELESKINKTIDVEIVIYEHNLLKISIKDYGPGFNFVNFECKESMKNDNRFQGRGIVMVNQMSSAVFYQDNGSKVNYFIRYGDVEYIKKESITDEEILRDLTLLYVEDDPLIRTQFEKILRRLVKRVYVANDGKEGLDIYQVEHPDIVLTDIEMPYLDGLEMSKHIKDINPEQSIAIMTAYNEEYLFIKAIDVGVDKYVLKPVKIPQLTKALHSIGRQIYYKKEAKRLLREQEEKNNSLLMDLKEKNRYSLAQEKAASKKQELIIHDDSKNFSKIVSNIYYKPLERLSGDIYGIFKMDDEDNVFAFIVDSMGKGLPAYVTAVLSAAFINRSAGKSIAFNAFDLQRLIVDYQSHIKRYLLEDECVSFLMIHLDMQKKEFKYSSYGMYPIVVQDCDTLQINQYKSNNPPFFKYLPLVNISENIKLPNNFSLYCFSDGLVETEFFGMNEFIYHLQDSDKSTRDLFKKLTGNEFIPDDDITLINIASTKTNQ
jgi:CheY-like chemotaxis protein/serine phosphatase RsbU (regulator of sigma subunit)